AGRQAALHRRADSDVPAAYRSASITAAYCRDEVPEVTPALLAASLKALSDFDPSLTDPAKDEYGIARWTPRVLWHYLPERERPRAHELVYDPYVSIHYMGTYICTLAPRVLHLAEDPLDRQILAATIFQSNTRDMISARGVPPYARWYADKVREYLPRYTPWRGARGGERDRRGGGGSRWRCSARTRSNRSATETGAARCQSALPAPLGSFTRSFSRAR